VRPLAIDLYTGLHGWSEGLIAAGFHVLGCDLEDMSRKLGEHLPPEHFALWLQNVLTLHGSQFKDARLIVGSSPCQEFSYRAMPWKRAKALGPPEIGLALFHAQFRIQREASEAAGRHIPLVVENVRGAQPWVGRARANFGSYFVWGDVPALMPNAPARKVAGFRFDGSGRSFQTAAVNGTKVAGMNWSNYGKPGYKAVALNDPRHHMKAPAGTQWLNDGPRTPDSLASSGSKSPARKAASAKIAKIPFPLAYWIGLSHHPDANPDPWARMVESGLHHKYAFASTVQEVGQADLFDFDTPPHPSDDFDARLQRRKASGHQ